MREKIIKYFELTNATEAFSDFIDLSLNSVKATFVASLGNEIANVALVRVKAVVKGELPKLIEKLIQLYVESYTEEEIDSMIAWVSSPVGQKIEAMRKQHTEIGFDIGQGVEAKVQEALEQLEKELVKAGKM